jgi:phosphoribosylformylglycinamidine synthase
VSPVRIEIASRHPDTRAATLQKTLSSRGFEGKIHSLELIDVYTLAVDLSSSQLSQVAQMLANPVTQTASIGIPAPHALFNWAIEVGFLPGVTDNVANTVREGIEDLFKARTI